VVLTYLQTALLASWIACALTWKRRCTDLRTPGFSGLNGPTVGDWLPKVMAYWVFLGSSKSPPKSVSRALRTHAAPGSRTVGSGTRRRPTAMVPPPLAGDRVSSAVAFTKVPPEKSRGTFVGDEGRSKMVVSR
jgi:hypothetical protein